MKKKKKFLFSLDHMFFLTAALWVAAAVSGYLQGKGMDRIAVSIAMAVLCAVLGVYFNKNGKGL